MEKSLGRLRLFIVDDSMLMCGRLTEFFATLPHIEVCGVADNVAQAIAAILAQPVDVVLLDLDLGKDSGLDVLKAVKQGPAAPIVVVLTIHPFKDLGRHCLEAGADHYFEKGNAFDGVLNLLDEISLKRTAQCAPTR